MKLALKEVPKFCKNCKYHVNGECHHPENMKYNLVTGDGYPIASAEELRNTDLEEYCGDKALWFEPIPQQNQDVHFGDIPWNIALPETPQNQQPRSPKYAVDPMQFTPPRDESNDPPVPGKRILLPL